MKTRIVTLPGILFERRHLTLLWLLFEKTRKLILSGSLFEKTGHLTLSRFLSEKTGNVILPGFMLLRENRKFNFFILGVYFLPNCKVFLLILPSGSMILLEIPKPPDNFGNISLTKAICRIYFKENCLLEHFLQLLTKYFANLSFIPKLFLKVWQVQTTLVKWISRHEWPKRYSVHSWPVGRSGLNSISKLLLKLYSQGIYSLLLIEQVEIHLWALSSIMGESDIGS